MTVSVLKLPSPTRQARKSILAGMAIILGGFGGFGVWGAVAPLASASIAPGTVVVSSNRQTIQHREGGIIAELRVREGSTVQSGDVLVRLDDTQARATYELIRGQHLAAMGEEARLIAERDGAAAITFPEVLQEEQAEPVIAAVIAGQRHVFDSRRRFVDSQRAILEQRRAQLEQEIAALDAQQRAEARQLDLIAEEMRAVETLVNSGLERRPRLLALQRAAANIEGSRGEHLAMIARAQQQISGLQVELAELENRIMTEVVTQLREVQTRIFDLAQRLRATRDLLNHIDIRAPRSGTVVNLRYHTIGGVIQPASPILDIVPNDDNLIVEIQLNPMDIDVLRAGMLAEVTLSAFDRRSVPPLDGTLVLLSADRLVDQHTGTSYYLGRVEVDRDQLGHLPSVQLVPGMPAEVMIRTGERTPLEYLLNPIIRSVNRAFRET